MASSWSHESRQIADGLGGHEPAHDCGICGCKSGASAIWMASSWRDILNHLNGGQTMMRNFFLVAALSLLALPLSARAQDACKADAERLCKDIPPGGGRIIGCLKSHEADLSPACKERMAAGKGRMEGVKEACKPDVEKFCKEIKPGDGRIAACLKSHDGELAPACRQIVDKVESAIHETHEACNSDAEKFCQGIQPGGGRIRACLKSHEAELSEACKVVFDRGKPAK
jgi:hypothetical protein